MALLLLLAAAASNHVGLGRLAFLPLRLRLVTFDLDDTLWPQDPVVARANDAMTAELRRRGVDAGTEEVAAEMRAIRRERSELAKARGEQPFRISYSDLRTEGIAAVLASHAGEGRGTAGAAAAAAREAEDVFSAWLEARHKAAADLFFQSAPRAIAELRQQHPDVVVGAITNSRADPFAVPSLAPLFDFTISGEDADVFPHRKPSLEIFEKAVERARALAPSPVTWPDAAAGDRSRWWVHAGDDLPNDVRAAALAGARAVWVTGDGGAESAAIQARPSYSTATPEEVAERSRAAAEARGMAAAEVSSVAELPGLLRSWSTQADGSVESAVQR